MKKHLPLDLHRRAICARSKSNKLHGGSPRIAEHCERKVRRCAYKIYEYPAVWRIKPTVYDVAEKSATIEEAEWDASAAKSSWETLLKSFFLPAGYPDSVTPDYASWLSWHLASLFCRDVLEVLASQSLLVAVAVSTKLNINPDVAAPLAAATKWVLKDGFGSIATLAVGSRGGQSFDSDPKRWWVVTSALEDLARLVEVLLPLQPQFFLPAAALANAIRSGSLVGRNSLVNGTFIRHFGLRENFSDIRAKLEAQGRILALISLPLGIWIFRCIQNLLQMDQSAEAFPLGLVFTLGIYMTIFAAHNFTCYKASDSLSFRTLNERRLCIVAEQYITNGKISKPGSVSHTEGVFRTRRLDHSPILGASFNTLATSVANVEEIIELYKNDGYILCIENRVPHIIIKQTSSNEDFLKAALQAQQLKIEDNSLTNLWEAIRKSKSFADDNTSAFKQALIDADWEPLVVRGPWLTIDIRAQ